MTPSSPIADVHARRGNEETHRSAARGMFESIAPTYDLLNRLMSAGTDRRWRAKAVEELKRAPRGPVLDLCAGTMDLAGQIARERSGDRVVALDFSPAMLERGRAKAPTVEIVVADACALPFAEATFVGVICGFGMRNLADPRRGAGEVLRVLERGGVFVTLEFFRPTALAPRAFHAAYARGVLPTLGGWISGERSAYRYLARSMGGFFSRAEYEDMLRDVGFTRVRGTDLTLGIASIVCASAKG